MYSIHFYNANLQLEKAFVNTIDVVYFKRKGFDDY